MSTKTRFHLSCISSVLKYSLILFIVVSCHVGLFAFETKTTIHDVINSPYISDTQREKLTELTSLIDSQPENSIALNDRGVCLTQLGADQLAYPDLIRATDLDPKNEIYWFNRGVLENRARTYKKAITSFSTAIEIDPEFTLAFHERCIALLKSGFHEEAMQDINAVIAKNPMVARLFNLRAQIYYHQKEWDHALADLKEARRIGFGECNHLWRMHRANHRTNALAKSFAAE